MIQKSSRRAGKFFKNVLKIGGGDSFKIALFGLYFNFFTLAGGILYIFAQNTSLYLTLAI